MINLSAGTLSKTCLTHFDMRCVYDWLCPGALSEEKKKEDKAIKQGSIALPIIGVVWIALAIIFFGFGWWFVGVIGLIIGFISLWCGIVGIQEQRKQKKDKQKKKK